MSTRRIPRPGARVRGSATGRPVMALLDLLGRRWALRVIWELRDDRHLTFRAMLCERIPALRAEVICREIIRPAL